MKSSSDITVHWEKVGFAGCGAYVLELGETETTVKEHHWPQARLDFGHLLCPKCDEKYSKRHEKAS